MNVDLYCCYSLPLRNFLYDHGLRYKLAALNPRRIENKNRRNYGDSLGKLVRLRILTRKPLSL